jgi:hypothetical protein
MLGFIDPQEPDYEGLESYCRLLDALGILYASLMDDGVNSALFIRIISYPSYATTDFAAFAREKRPRSLILIAYYLVFVKLVKNVWWVEGFADREIKMIADIVGTQWQSYLEIPLEAVGVTDDQEIIKLLLRVPSQDKVAPLEKFDEGINF